MRRAPLLAILLTTLLASAAMAADDPQLPKDLQPLPAPPPPPPGYEPNPQTEPEVTIVPGNESTVEEYRIGGKLYMMKVTPKHGKPYYLVDERGDGHFFRMDNLDSGVRVPQWVIFQF
jgi:hypothetical protein